MGGNIYRHIAPQLAEITIFAAERR